MGNKAEDVNGLNVCPQYGATNVAYDVILIALRHRLAVGP